MPDVLDETGAAKLIIEVRAAIIPGQPEGEYTARWSVSSKEWQEAEKLDEALLAADDAGHAFHRYLLVNQRAAKADEYARLLRDPSRFNVVTTEWVWL